MEPKKSYLSKTIITNFIVALGAMIYPPLAEWVSAHPQELVIGFSVLNIGLRLITKDKIELW